MSLHTFQQHTLPPRSVVIKPVGGLGSRMKCVASFGAIAKHFDVPLHVFWDTSVGFEKIECGDLFETLPANVQLIDHHSWSVIRAHRGRVVRLDERISYLTQNYKYADYKLDELFTTRKPFHLTAECNRDLQKLYGNVLRRFIPDFNTTYLHHLSCFKPVADVRELVAHEVNCWGNTTTDVLGVHIRRNDALYSRVGNKYANPTDQQLKVAIDNHLAQTPASASTTPTHIVFLSVDDPSAFQFFQHDYADEPRVRWYPWNRYTYKLSAEKTGQRKALVDLMTLRCCNRVIGTTFSVFNEIAQVPLARSVVLDTYCPARRLMESSRDGVHKLAKEMDDEADPALAATTPAPTPSAPPTNSSHSGDPHVDPALTNSPATEAPTSSPATEAPTNSPATEAPTHTTTPDVDTHDTHDTPLDNANDKQAGNQKQEPNPTQSEKDTNTTETLLLSSIPRKTLEYLYNANPDAVAYQKQMQALLGLPTDHPVQE